MPMTDLIALAVAFPRNLEAKITNIHRRYSKYLHNYFFSKKHELQGSDPDMVGNHSFKIVRNENYIFNKVKTLTTDL